jgi:hypothetical protein
MKKMISLIISVMFLSAPVYAGEFADLKAKIGEVRTTAITMLNDITKRGETYQKAAVDSNKAAITAFAKIKVSASKEAKFKELQTVWNEFRKTREEQVIPLLLAGKQADAEKLATGVQKERLQKINALCDELEKP